MEMRKSLNYYMKRIVCICAAWMGLALTMQAQTCKFSVENGTVAQGTENELSVTLTNEATVSGGQFTIALPQGITIKDIALNDSRSNGHSIEYRLNETANSAMILFYAQPTAAFKGNDGTLCTLTIEADADMNSGEYEVILSDVRLASDAITAIDAIVTCGVLTVTSRYQITIEATEGGTVHGEGIYNAGDTVKVVAIPSTGYHFVKWSDGSSDNPYLFEAIDDVHLSAEFAPNVYTIVYMVDGEEYIREEVTFGNSITEVEAPEKEGHTFDGWEGLPETMPAGDVTVKGSYTPNVYKVTYILDGEVFKVEEVVYGTAVPTPEVPAKEGYNFSGWGEIPETMPAKDITLTGSYTINKDMKYDLIYIVDGVEYKRVTLSFGDTIVLEEEPEKEGHTFSGWSEVPETMPLHDVTATGSFTANSYTLTFTIDGDTFKTEIVVFGTAITAPEAPEKEGHTFNGWEGLPETMPAGDVTVKGSYTPNVYKVTYILDGEVFKVEEVVYGTAVPTPEVPAKEGYNFSGWGEVPETMPAKDITLTGSYTINKDMKYDLIYMVDGVEYKRVTLSFGDAIVLEEAPEKEGHTFSGWSEVPETMPLHDVTISGTFIVNKYLVTFKIDDNVIASDSLEYGTTIVAPEAPEKEGYTFDDWGEIAQTVPAADVTYEGSYTINTYKVYYYVGDELVHTDEVTYGEEMPEYTYEPGEGYTFLGWIGESYETMPAHDVTYTANIKSGISKIATDIGQSIIYDITGRRVLDMRNIKSGIYIVNGKKMLIK